MVDELLYSELAKTLAEHGHFLVRGEPYSGLGVVYPALIAPAFRLFGSVPDAYVAAKAINSVVMSLAAVPAYFLARRVVRPGLALVAALLTVAVPSMRLHRHADDRERVLSALSLPGAAAGARARAADAAPAARPARALRRPLPHPRPGGRIRAGGADRAAAPRRPATGSSASAGCTGSSAAGAVLVLGGSSRAAIRSSRCSAPTAPRRTRTTPSRARSGGSSTTSASSISISASRPSSPSCSSPRFARRRVVRSSRQRWRSPAGSCSRWRSSPRAVREPDRGAEHVLRRAARLDRALAVDRARDAAAACRIGGRRRRGGLVGVVPYSGLINGKRPPTRSRSCRSGRCRTPSSPSTRWRPSSCSGRSRLPPCCCFCRCAWRSCCPRSCSPASGDALGGRDERARGIHHASLGALYGGITRAARLDRPRGRPERRRRVPLVRQPGQVHALGERVLQPQRRPGLRPRLVGAGSAADDGRDGRSADGHACTARGAMPTC